MFHGIMGWDGQSSVKGTGGHPVECPTIHGIMGWDGQEGHLCEGQVGTHAYQ